MVDKTHDVPLDFGWLRQLDAREQEAWAEANFSPMTVAVLRKKATELDIPFVDCIILMIAGNLGLVRKLIQERRERLAREQGEQLTQEEPVPDPWPHSQN